MQLLSADLEHGVPRNNFIPPILQIAATLRFYATGHFEITDGDLFGLSQLPRDGGMAEDHGAPEAGQLPRVWTRGHREIESRQRVSGVKSP